MQSTRIKATVGLLGVAVLLTALYFLQEKKEPATTSNAGRPDSQATEHSTGNAGSNIPATQTSALQLWETGEEHRYLLKQQTEISSSSSTPATLKLAGVLRIARIAPTTLRYQFEGKSSGLGPARSQQGASELSKPFFTEHDSRGKLQLRLNSSTPAAVAQIWKSLASTLQLQLSDNRADQWQFTEAGPLGNCLIKYEKTGPNRIRKTRQSCQIPEGIQAVEIEHQSSEQRFELRENRFDQVESNEVIRTAAEQAVPSFASATNLSLKYLDSNNAQSKLGRWKVEAAASRGTLIGIKKQDVDSALSQEELLARIGKRTFSSVMSKMLEFEKLVQSRELTSEENATFGRSFIALRSMLQMDSKHLADIESHILHDGPLTPHLLGLLGEAGTPAAQQVLTSYITDTQRQARERTLAGIALGRSRKPTKKTVHTLRKLQDDPAVRDQVTYSLGSNIKRLQATDPDLGKKVLGNLLEDLDHAPIDDKARFLTALGNAGAPEALPTLTTYAESTVAKLRRNAALGLRRVPGVQADTALLELATDQDRSVRRQAVTSIASRPPTLALANGISEIALTEPEFSVRAKAVEAAARWLAYIPTLQEPLREVAANDANDQLRRTAARFLERNGY